MLGSHCKWPSHAVCRRKPSKYWNCNNSCAAGWRWCYSWAPQILQCIWRRLPCIAMISFLPFHPHSSISCSTAGTISTIHMLKNLPSCELRSVSCILSQSFASDLLLSARLIKRWEQDCPLWHQQGQSPARSHSCSFSSLQSISNVINLMTETITCPALACSTLILLPMQCHSIHC